MIWRSRGFLLVAALGLVATSSISWAQSPRADAKQRKAEGQRAQEAGRLKQAIAAYAQAIEAANQTTFQPDELWFVAEIHYLKARAHYDLKQAKEAEIAAVAAVAIHDRQLDEKTGHNHLVITARALAQQGRIAMDLRGDFLSAQRKFENSLGFWKYLEENLGVRDAGRPLTHNDLGQLYESVGLAAEARREFEQSQAMWARLKHPNEALAVTCLGLLALRERDFSQAKTLFENSLKLYRNDAKVTPATLAKVHSNLGWACHATGDTRSAAEHYAEALKLWEGQGDSHAREKARTLSNRGWLHQADNRFQAARADYQESLKLRQGGGAGSGEADEREMALALTNLALLHVSLREWDSAQQQMDAACRADRTFIGKRLPILPERVQLSFLLDSRPHDSHAAFLHSSVSIALAGRERPGLVEASTAWVLNGKSIAQEALARRELVARDSRSEAARKLLALREQLSTAAFLATPDPEASTKTLELESLAADFGRKVVNEERPWIEPEHVRSAIPADAVLVELVRYRQWDFAATRAEKWQAERYAAWVLPRSGRGQLIDLGPGRLIEEAVEAVLGEFRRIERLHAEAADKVAAAPEVEQETRVFLERLAALVLWPLTSHIGHAKHWILSPDHTLWLVPWAALPIEKGGSYAVETKSISYVSSGRDLLRPRVNVQTGPVLLVAFPNYDAGVAVNKKLRLGRQGPLEGTKKEAELVAPLLAELTGQTVTALIADKALEGTVKRTPSPRVLVLSTHGFFLGDERTENPLFHCGVALVGCNKGSDGDGNNGILTGQEVLGLDLRGTDLVVLSACQTALGRVNAGEGVASLRQSFQLAGARTVLATLWSVPDEETQRLLGAFFTELAKSRVTKAEALARAQRQTMEYVKQYGATHPFFWAAFTITGDPGNFQ